MTRAKDKAELLDKLYTSLNVLAAAYASSERPTFTDAEYIAYAERGFDNPDYAAIAEGCRLLSAARKHFAANNIAATWEDRFHRRSMTETRFVVDTYMLRATMPPCDIHAFTSSAGIRYKVESPVGAAFDAWIRGAIARRSAVVKATTLISAAAKHANSVAALLSALPGLRDIMRAIAALPTTKSADESIIERLCDKTGGRNVFDAIPMQAQHPMWRTSWAETHRPTLLSAVAAVRDWYVGEQGIGNPTPDKYTPSGAPFYIMVYDVI